MNYSLTLFAAVSLLGSFISQGAEKSSDTANPTAEQRAQMACILTAGDSIVETYPGENPRQQGWGQRLDDFLLTSEIYTENFAISGRSTKTFKGDWKRLSAKIKKGTFVFIQFGHNDSHKKGRGESTDAGTDYKANLTTYVQDVKSKGGLPVLVTPPTRRHFVDGQLQTFIISKTVGPSNLAPFAKAMKDVAKQEDVPLVDLFAISSQLVQSLGKEGCAKLYTDIAHNTGLGAKVNAKIILSELVKQKHPVTKYIDTKALNQFKIPK